MKKILCLLILNVCLSVAHSQQLLKYNYRFLDAEEEGKDPKTEPPFTFDNYSSFVNNLGGGFTVLPNLKFNGTYYYGQRFAGTSGVFFAENNIDSLIPERANQLYFPESSTFGFHLNGSLGLHKIFQEVERKDKSKVAGRFVGNRFSFNGSMFFLTKKLKDSVKEKLTDETAHMLHFKWGFEWAIDKDNLSFFTNFNHVSVLTKRDFFRNAFNYSRNSYAFADAGFQARAELAGDKLQTYITLGSIIHSGDTQSLSGGTTDLIVPYVKFGLYIPIAKD